MNENQCNCVNDSSKKETLRDKLDKITGRLVEIDKLACTIESKTFIPLPRKSEERCIPDYGGSEPKCGSSIENFVNTIDDQTKDIIEKLINIDGLI